MAKLDVSLFFRRLKGFSLKRMTTYLNDVKKETKLPKFLILLDMLYCIPAYHVGFFDYHIFGFIHIPKPSDRRTFFTMNDNWRLCRMVNSPDTIHYFQNKLDFTEAFRDYLGREVLNLEKNDAKALYDFLKKHPVVFIKNPDSFGGLQVRRYEVPADLTEEAAAALYSEWKENTFLLVEEAITQHPEMSRLYPDSVNTIRIVTLLDPEGNPHVLYHFIRTGRGGAHIDNTTSGGLSTLICEDGIIRKPALSDKTGLYHDEHPDTHVSFIGFKVPYFAEAIELCKKAARVLPGMGYIGWDVAITPDGPVLVEGNDLPAYDGQIYHQQEHPGRGLKPLVQSIRPDF